MDISDRRTRVRRALRFIRTRLRDRSIILAAAVIMALLAPALLRAAPDTLSRHSSVSLITCEPSDAIYTSFGHSAIRITDSVSGADIFFHWGVFSFDAPHFVWRFVKGETDYEMGVVPRKYFLREYRKRNTAVHEQLLDMTYAQRKAVYEAVWENYRPENRTYRYNFVFDNCATRPYHMIMDICGDSIVPRHEEGVTTFRDIIWQHIGRGSFWSLAIDIVIGSEADRPIGTDEMIGFPLYTMQTVGSYETIKPGGLQAPFVTRTQTIVDGRVTALDQRPLTAESAINTAIPAVVFILLMLTAHKCRAAYKTLAAALLAVTALCGCVVFFLMFVSEHPLVHENYNLMWLNPLYIISIVLLFTRPSRFGRAASLVLFAVTALFAVILITGLQRMCLPLMLWWAVTAYICFNLYLKQRQTR